MAFKKNREWIRFKLNDGQEIKLLIRDHPSGNNKLGKIVIDCPENIKIDRKEDDSMGNF